MARTYEKMLQVEWTTICNKYNPKQPIIMTFYPKNDAHVMNGEGFGESVFTKMIKAGHRTYFIDVKTTRSNDYFLSVTELRKKITQDGNTVNERNKVFVYQEDIDKFTEGLNEVIKYIRSVAPAASDSDK